MTCSYNYHFRSRIPPTRSNEQRFRNAFRCCKVRVVWLAPPTTNLWFFAVMLGHKFAGGTRLLSLRVIIWIKGKVDYAHDMNGACIRRPAPLLQSDRRSANGRVVRIRLQLIRAVTAFGVHWISRLERKPLIDDIVWASLLARTTTTKTTTTCEQMRGER